MPSPTDAVRASVFVRLSPETTFRLFTTRIDSWWRRGPRFRRSAGSARPAGSEAAAGLIHLEPGIGGRLFESWSGEQGEVVAEVGRVLLWDAPRALSFSWRGANFEPQQQTLVEVLFEPQGEGTRVSVCHRGWDGLPPDAPVRHGQHSAAFLRTMGLWWGDLLLSLRALGHAGAAGPAAVAAAAAPATLRVATREDVAGIQYVRHAVQENRLSSRVIGDAEVRAYLEQHGRGWVVVQGDASAPGGGEVVGFAIADARDGSLWALFVDPAHEGRGHGSRLHDTMVQWLFAQGLPRLQLGTGEHTRAQAFYARRGWREQGPRTGGEVAMVLEAPGLAPTIRGDDEPPDLPGSRPAD